MLTSSSSATIIPLQASKEPDSPWNSRWASWDGRAYALELPFVICRTYSGSLLSR
jgi:hypothetical protein